MMVVAAVVWAAPARAETEQQADALAREMFAVGKYREALQIYGRLYADTPHPTYIRNIGRCYQNLGEPERAISSFREYLRQVPTLAPAQRAQIEGYIQEMQALQRARAAAAPAPAPAPAVSVGSPPLAPTPAPAAGPANDRSSVDAGERSQAPFLAGVGTAVVGAAGVAVGVVFALQSRSKNDRALALCGPTVCETRTELEAHDTLVREARSARTLSIVGFAAGGAALVAGSLLMWTARRDGGTRLAAWTGDREAGLLLAGRW